MLNTFQKRASICLITTSTTSPLLTFKSIFSSTAANEPERQNNNNGIEPPKIRAMKKPIIKGRLSKDKKTMVLADTVENPFKGRALPFGRRLFFDTPSEEDLARGKSWSKFVDRFCQYIDFDLVEKSFDDELYKIPKFKRPFDDITMKPDIELHHHLENFAIHVDMARYIPHLKPLLPELRQDFTNVTKYWNKVLQEVFLDDKNSKSKTKMKTTLSPNDKWGPNGLVKQEEVIEETKSETENRLRKEEVFRELQLTTVKQFVDDKVEERDYVRLIFIDAMGTKYFIYGMVGETLLQACRRYLIPIDGYCNSYDRGHVRIYGHGAFCHSCQMDISPKYFHLIPPFDWNEKNAFLRFRSITPTSRLGCCIWIRPEFDGMVVNIPVTLVMPYGRTED